MGAAWLVGLDQFGAWNLAVRNDTIGTTLTGFLIAGGAYSVIPAGRPPPPVIRRDATVRGPPG